MFYANIILNLLASASIAASGASFDGTANVLYSYQNNIISNTKNIIPEVPFYSQFRDIDSKEWQKLGCGVTSLAMLINFYKPNSVTVNNLLKEGIADGAYLDGAGWKHSGLVLLAKKYNLKSEAFDFSNLTKEDAFIKLEKSLKEGPVIVSIHYKFDIKSSIPHLAVINGIDGNIVYYNDPAGKSAGEKISVEDFIKVWKKRFITVRS